MRLSSGRTTESRCSPRCRRSSRSTGRSCCSSESPCPPPCHIWANLCTRTTNSTQTLRCPRETGSESRRTPACPQRERRETAAAPAAVGEAGEARVATAGAASSRSRCKTGRSCGSSLGMDRTSPPQPPCRTTRFRCPLCIDTCQTQSTSARSSRRALPTPP